MKNYLSITNTAAVVGLAFALSACSSQEEMVAKPAPVAPACGSKGRSKSRSESSTGESNQNCRRHGIIGY